MQKVTEEKTIEVIKPKTHLRLKIDLTTYHLTPFKDELQLQPGSRVKGWQASWLCFTILYTRRS